MILHIKSDLFTDTDRACFEELKARGIARVYRRGCLIADQHNLGEVAFAVGKGVVKVQLVSSDGGVRTLTYLADGALFGQAAAFLDLEAPSALSVEAVTDSQLYLLSRQTLRRAIQDNPAMPSLLLKCAALQIYNLMNQIEVTTFGDTVHAVAAVILSLPHIIDDAGNRRVEISQEELANIVGKTRVHVARALRSLSAMQLLTTTGKRCILIHNVPGLADIAGTAAFPPKSTTQPSLGR